MKAKSLPGRPEIGGFRAIFVPLDGETAAQEFLPGRRESIAFSGKVCYNAKERKIAKYFSVPDFRERK